jgi:hypothetical protein
MSEKKLTTERPSRSGAQAAEPAHVERARDSVTEKGAKEKKIPLLAPERYHKVLQEIKGMTSDSTPVKYLLLEAIDDLVKKYERGEGRFEVEDIAELRRRLLAVK